MKGMKIKFLSILMIFACFSVFSQSYRNLFNSKITESELTQLANGETVIRNVGSKKNLSLTNSNSEYITKIKEELEEHGISHTTVEIETPEEECEDLICKPKQNDHNHNHSHSHHHHH